jgi:hypothetical protein
MSHLPTVPLTTTGFYRSVLGCLDAAHVPCLVGGTYAYNAYTGIERETKDLDLFLRPGDYSRSARVLQQAGFETDLTHPHWLGKVRSGSLYIDLIFNSGNGIAQVDDDWFRHARGAMLFGMPVRMVPVEELLWSKAYVMERERYDGADVAHLLRATADTLDWHRLAARIGAHWRVLLSHLVLFGFIYPADRARVPPWLMQRLIEQLQSDAQAPPPLAAPCQGTLLSRAQYLHDVECAGELDARLTAATTMSVDDVAAWTESIGKQG